MDVCSFDSYILERQTIFGTILKSYVADFCSFLLLFVRSSVSTAFGSCVAAQMFGHLHCSLTICFSGASSPTTSSTVRVVAIASFSFMKMHFPPFLLQHSTTFFPALIV